MLPSTLSGWIIFYLFLLAVVMIVVWAITGNDLPQSVSQVLTGVVSGFLGFLRGKTDKDTKNTD